MTDPTFKTRETWRNWDMGAGIRLARLLRQRDMAAAERTVKQRERVRAAHKHLED